MMPTDFDAGLKQLFEDYEQRIAIPNEPPARSNGVLQRWKNPVLSAVHTPVFWRYDLNR